MTTRIAIYARYSSDLQSDSSIEDQVRLCSKRANAEGWKVVNCFSDAGLSGASMMRPGIQSLLNSAINDEFDILLAEALDRLSRDQEDIAGIYKRTEFAGVKIITLSEGEISSLHIGLKGTMNAMFLKDLADKTRRGLQGRVEKGKSGGGLAYGYRVPKKLNAQGEAIRGELSIDEEQAKVIRRIFHEYALENKSPKTIASDLNRDEVPCPSGKAWGQSTINGNRKRGTGILNNPLYIGQRVWNRQRFIKDPNTGKRVSRLNPESEWILNTVEGLRIVSQELWDTAKSRQQKLDKCSGNLGASKRPQYLLSGLLVCGECGGGFSKINAERYGCSNARNKGDTVCTNKTSIRGDKLEKMVMQALEHHLMRDELVQIFCDEYTKHLNELRSAQNAALKKHKAEAARLEKERENIIQAIKDGVPAEMIKDDLIRISEQQENLKKLMASDCDEPQPLVHPTMSRRYREEVKALHKSMSERKNAQTKEVIRSLIEKIVLTPNKGQDDLWIDLYGDLAGILTIAAKDKSLKTGAVNKDRPETTVANDNHNFRSSVQLVAGTGFEPMTFGL
jgi:site-specific DNA recombinase